MVEGTKIYQGTRQGFAAYIEIVDTIGNKSTGTARFRLPEKTTTHMRNTINLPGTDLILELDLFTERLGEIEGLEQLGAQSMATLMKVTSVEDHRRQFRGVVFIENRLLFEGLTLNFKSLKPYTSFVMVRDYGIPVIFTGFGLLLIALVVTYFWVPEHYWAVMKKREGRVIIGASTEKYKDSFKDHFKESMEDLRSKLSAT